MEDPSKRLSASLRILNIHLLVIAKKRGILLALACIVLVCLPLKYCNFVFWLPSMRAFLVFLQGMLFGLSGSCLQTRQKPSAKRRPTHATHKQRKDRVLMDLWEATDVIKTGKRWKPQETFPVFTVSSIPTMKYRFR